jgi:hypothetical protein
MLSPYVNFHRCFFFPRTSVDAKGRQRRIYRYEDMMTPFDKLASVADVDPLLKPGRCLAAFKAEASAISDREAARLLKRAKTALFEQILRPRKSA